MGIEDEIKLEDILKEPTEIVMAKIYIQTLKTNGIVRRHETDIGCLKTDMKNKISWDGLKKFGIIITIIIALLTIPTAVLNIINILMK